MTLHLISASDRYVAHVSDRLVSGSMNDPLANKQIIYCARDALVSIGYTGMAYGLSPASPNMPTDEWLAEILWGRPIPRGQDGTRPVTMIFGQISNRLDLGRSIQILRDELQAAISRLPCGGDRLRGRMPEPLHVKAVS